MIDIVQLAAESEGGLRHRLRQAGILNMLVQTGQFDKAEEIAQNLAKRYETQKNTFETESSLFTLADIQRLQGRPDGSLATILRIRSKAESTDAMARCHFMEALAVHEQGNLKRARQMLLDLGRIFPQAPIWAAFAMLNASWLWCIEQESKDARAAIAEAERLFPGLNYLKRGVRSRYTYVPDLVDNMYEEAAIALLEDGRCDYGQIVMHAEQFCMAGIVLELAGKSDKAREIWTNAALRYPPAHCCFFGELARNFRDGTDDGLETMPYGPQKRSEMFYLAGLLYESRGNSSRASKLFTLSATEDKSRRWPSWLASGKLRIEEG